METERDWELNGLYLLPPLPEQPDLPDLPDEELAPLRDSCFALLGAVEATLLYLLPLLPEPPELPDAELPPWPDWYVSPLGAV